MVMTSAITSHGIGNHRKDYNRKWGVETLLMDDVDSFYYEDINDKTLSTRLIKFGVKKAIQATSVPVGDDIGVSVADYLTDLIVFFFQTKTRNKIIQRKKEQVKTKLNHGYGKIYLIGHSLGSVVDYLFVKQYPELAKHCVLISVGSPLGSPKKLWRFQFGLGKVVKFILEDIILNEEDGLSRPEVIDWYNFMSSLDPISGYIYGMGVWEEDQYNVESDPLHCDVDLYIEKVRKVIMAEQSP